jgi:hypothetical protein
MTLLPDALRAALLANGAERPDDPVPLLKLFNPLGPATWLATELGSDGDTLFGLADLGFGCPELGYFSLSEIAVLRLPFGLRIARDRHFIGTYPLSVYAAVARVAGAITDNPELPPRG